MKEIINTWDQVMASGGNCVVIFRSTGGFRKHYIVGWEVSRFVNGKKNCNRPRCGMVPPQAEMVQQLWIGKGHIQPEASSGVLETGYLPM